MKKLIWFTILMTLSQGFMILSQCLSDKGNIWIVAIGVVIIIGIMINFLLEYKKLNKLK
ncbi:MAG: hypothetical protein K9I95_11840 [Flavobacteriaceae bacterium]|jgi:hypothetical protein|nr:hypothetical protein [Flavobacteriaceae bacterium]